MVLRRVFYLALAAMMAFMVSCKDKDEEQPTPTSEPTPVVPTREITLDMVWRDIIAGNVSKDTIKKYTDMEDVKFVFLNFTYNDDVTPGTTSTYPTIAFHTVRDTLQTRFDISPKVRGSGIIYVNASGGAHVQSTTSGTGMAEVDSIWYADKGYQIERYGGENSRGM